MHASNQVAQRRSTTFPLDVLIIDGDKGFTRNCVKTIESSAYTVVGANTAQAGLAVAETSHPRVVIVDWNTPGGNGLEILKSLAEREPTAVPVVVTANATVDAAVEAMKHGAFDFLAKPVDSEKLLETVRRGLDLSSLRKEAAGAEAETDASKKYDLLLQGLDVLGEAYSMGIEKKQLLDELTFLENEAKYHAESLGQIKKKERVILDIRNDLAEVDAILRKYDFQKNSLIQVLLDVQESFRWLPRHILNWISGRLNIPIREIYVIANFYEAFSLAPRGRHTIHVCTGTACHVRGASETLTRISSTLGIAAGETDKDQEFTLETVHCIGCCALAPVVQIDKQYYRDPSKKELEKIIKTLKQEKEEPCLA
ncbi:MAG: NAD(P)H-dependent oxidoreductase subunit E [Acidobacteria bacterium]|nr:NAD(P)H-dependent oxidoreductase subunit E [Acidobacteriota bacterium]